MKDKRVYLSLEQEIFEKLKKKSNNLGLKEIAYIRMLIFKDLNNK